MAMAFVIFIAFSLVLNGALGELVCEQLPIGICSYAISSTGKRCLLETYVSKERSTELQCKTSEVVVDNINEYIETDECIKACGLERKSVGISSDTLLEPGFAVKICSTDCSENCPNIVDLHTNMALAEGVSLPELCKAIKTSPRRAMVELLSSGAVAESTVATAAPPTISPAPIAPLLPSSN